MIFTPEFQNIKTILWISPKIFPIISGDLRKIFDFLSDESKSALNQIASDFSSNNSPVKSDNFYNIYYKIF